MKRTLTLLSTLALAFAMAPNLVLATEKPFAEKKVVLQLSEDDPVKQTLVLNVATNIARHYGPDKVDIEIVAFGPGLKLLFADNQNSGRIQGLVDGSGVRFAACMNTMAKMTEKMGHEPKLVAQAQPVPAGVVRIMELVERDYTLIKP